MSARAVWTGTLSVGLVSVGIKAYKATDEPNAETGCRQLHNACSTPINQKLHCAKCAVDVPYSDIVKGVEVADGKFVTLTAADLASIKPESTDTIAVESFVNLSEVDPLYVATSYYLTPDKGHANGYAVLQAVMTKKHYAAQGSLTIYGREHNVTIRPLNAGLVLQLMRTATEVRDAAELPNHVAKGAVPLDVTHLKLAEQLVESLKGSFDPTDYEDSYVAEFKALVASKNGGAAVAPKSSPVAAANVDLMAALQASLTAASGTKKSKRVAKVGVESKGKSSKRKSA